MNCTIVISNFNYADFVVSAIESCLEQTEPCHIIVVDDASTDNSWEVITSYVSRGIRAVRLKENSGGNARGKNVGICLSSTPYVTCLDADDMLLPNSIETRLKYMEQANFVHGWAFRVRSTKAYSRLVNEIRPFVLPKRARKLRGEDGPRWAFAIEASTVLAHRSLYEELGLYDEEMKWTIDREMWWRWLDHGATKKVLYEYVSIYRRHSNQVTGDRSRKDPKACTAMLSQRMKLRSQITAKNTLLMSNYDVDDFIEQIIEP